MDSPQDASRCLRRSQSYGLLTEKTDDRRGTRDEGRNIECRSEKIKGSGEDGGRRVRDLRFSIFDFRFKIERGEKAEEGRQRTDLEPIRITPEWPIYSKAMMPLKGFRDEKTKNKKQI